MGSYQPLYEAAQGPKWTRQVRSRTIKCTHGTVNIPFAFDKEPIANSCLFRF